MVIGSGIFTVIGVAIGGNPANKLADWKESPIVDLVLGALHHASPTSQGVPEPAPRSHSPCCWSPSSAPSPASATQNSPA